MKKTVMMAFMALAGLQMAQGADFFSTAGSEDKFSVGARIGVNTTNRTISDNALPYCYHKESWGIGFNLGVVATFNIRDWISVQPGLFYESRSGSYTLTGDPKGSGLMEGYNASVSGTRNSYNFTVPVMAVFNFNVCDELRWGVEVGPYVSLLLGSNVNVKAAITDSPDSVFLPIPERASAFDFGFKMGTSLTLHRRWYAGVHYMAGCAKAWKLLKVDNMEKNFGGITKGWIFSLGYDF